MSVKAKKQVPGPYGAEADLWENGVSNALFAKTDKTFIAACELAGVQPTQRQASKYRNDRGKAFQYKGEAS